MLSFVIFWFLLTRLIRCSENSTGLQVESFGSEGLLSPPAVIQVSVPEDHHLCLQCGGSDGSDVVWTRQDRAVLVTRQGNYETNWDPRRFSLLTGGELCLRRLDDSDSGEYRCNQQLVAELQVLSGHDFRVSAGWTLLLPCRGSKRPKQKWIHRREGGRRECILTRYKNGTVKVEQEENRYSFKNEALQILDLQPCDAGDYLCNGELQARVTVLTDHKETTELHSTSSSTVTPAGITTDVVEEEKKKEKKRPENALLLVAVVSLGLMVVLMASVCVLLTSMKCRRKRRNRKAGCEGLESPSPPEETIHYASLGRQNWRDRPCRTPPDQNHHNVIYSSVITRPAANKHKHCQTGMKLYI
ncbi:uncharacterized protein LOC122970051 [Scomber scombrus]|uniref:Uncharacterized protein LOC122970051 n=1 Tax=Scomber scombrus TaxID=13677 RepID=A0AAV1QG19_SCOSC